MNYLMKCKKIGWLNTLKIYLWYVGNQPEGTKDEEFFRNQLRNSIQVNKNFTDIRFEILSTFTEANI